LEPLVHKNLYERPEIDTAVQVLRQHPFIQGVAVNIDTEQFQLFSFDQLAEAPRAFTL
jgi:hypothetical protein